MWRPSSFLQTSSEREPGPWPNPASNVHSGTSALEAHPAQRPASVIRLKWHEPIVREAVEARRDEISAQLRCNEGEPGEGMPEPSAVYHLTREEIALIR